MEISGRVAVIVGKEAVTVDDAEWRNPGHAHVPPATADAVVRTNQQSRIDGLRSALSILALIALIAPLFTRGIPTVQPGAQTAGASPSGRATAGNPPVTA